MKTENTPKKTNIVDSVISRVNQMQQGGLRLPQNYSPENTLRAAWLILQDVQTQGKEPALNVCSQNSIANSLLKMVVNGLNPLKNQCYFIPYGKSLTCVPSYFGQLAIGKRAGLKSVSANVIREGDVFSYEIENTGRKKVTKHEQSFENLNKPIIGVYAVVTYPDDTIDTDIMTIDEVKKSWNQGSTKGNSPAHKNFDSEMCKRTVINRAIKVFVNSSDDSSLGIDDHESRDEVQEYVDSEIEEHAHVQEIGFEEQVAPVSEQKEPVVSEPVAEPGF